MAVGDALVSWLSLTSTTTNFFSKLPTAFLTFWNRDEWRKYAGKKFRHNLVLNSQPPGHESNTLNTKPPGWGNKQKIDHCRRVLNNTFICLCWLHTWSILIWRCIKPPLHRAWLIYMPMFVSKSLVWLKYSCHQYPCYFHQQNFPFSGNSMPTSKSIEIVSNP